MDSHDREPKPKSAGSFLSADSQLPELRLIFGQHRDERLLEIPLDHEGFLFKGILTLKINNAGVFEINFEATDDQKERVFDFFSKYKFNEDNEPYWLSDRRHVNSNFRNMGLARRVMQTLEDVQSRIAQMNPNQDFAYTEVQTRLSPVLRMIADHDWLARNGFSEYQSSENLGYMPQAVNPEDFKSKVEQKTTEINKELLWEDAMVLQKPNPNYRRIKATIE